MERNNNNSTNRDGLLLRFESRSAATTSSDFVLQWGNRKRLRCMKVQAKDQNHSTSGTGPVQRATARIDRRVIRSDLNGNINTRDPNSNLLNNNNGGKTNGGGNSNGYINLRQRSASPSHRILRNSETSLGMRGHSNGLKGLASPDRDCKKSGNNNNTHQHHNKSKDLHNDNHSNHHAGGGGVSGSSEATHDAKKGGSGGGLSSSGDRDMITTLWLPKFVIALTNKEKEEDFMAFKGSKLSQRPKKRAKFIQRTLNLVLPGGWLSDLTLERYEVREKKVSKKRPRGLKGMGNMESDSE